MKYTPETLTKENLFYNIPIYQRLFEWDTENILTLLDDLKKEYINTDGVGDYYIGMLTSTKDNELVDGQQRFTVMMLLGCVLQEYYSKWKPFLVSDNKKAIHKGKMPESGIRLYFISRPQDNDYLRALINEEGDRDMPYRNQKMLNAIHVIRKFMDDFMKDLETRESKIVNLDYKKSKEQFAKYIFHHLSFFISDLPLGYSPRDLNKYFERMNTSGKNLEQHEILKVKLLSHLDSEIDKYMLLWNKLADVDTLLIRPRKDEREETLRWRKFRALSCDISTIFSEKLINALDDNFHENSVSICDIVMSSVSPKKERPTNRDSRCALTFPYLLLQVLYRMVSKKKIKVKNIDDFFKPNNLLSIFEEYLPFNGKKVNKGYIKDFLELLVKARLALDICFVRLTEFGYSLDMGIPDDDEKLKKLMMFQSMLYVSSSNYTNYRWFNWLMDEVEKHSIHNAEYLYETLKGDCDKLFKLPEYEELTYQGDNRYWFWRLDSQIWLNRKQLFDKDSPELLIAENYIFKRNRSIEHIAPQTPQSNSMMRWGDQENKSSEESKLRDSFGNLVMISQGLNSALSNESYEVKTAHVKSYCNGSKSGSIESLKLLMVHKDYPDGWTKIRIKEHGQKMYRLLQESYAKDSEDQHTKV